MKKITIILFIGFIMAAFVFTTSSCTPNNNPTPIRDTIVIRDTVNTRDTVCVPKCFDAVACYPFDGNANDVSGNNFNGTVHNATLALGHKGEANSAYHFSSSNEYIDLPQFGTIISGNEFSISLWSKADAQQSNTVFALYPDNSSDRILAHVNYYTANNVTKLIFDVGNFSSGRHELLNQPFTTTWEHYVFIASQNANTIRVYRNGVLVINEVGYIAVSNRNKILRIASPFFGYIDNIKIFNKALIASDVADLYNE